MPIEGVTTITRLTPQQQNEFTQQHPSIQYQPLWLPVCPKDSEYSKRAVRGVIQDQAGKPISGAEVQCQFVSSPKGYFLRGIEPRSAVVADEHGRFQIYHPCRHVQKRNGTDRLPFISKFRFDPVISREIIPADSSYNLIVRAAHDLTYRPARVVHANSSETIVRLTRTTRIRKFQFNSINGQPIADNAQLSKITIRYLPPSANRLSLNEDEWIELDDRILMDASPVHPGYYWASYESESGETVSWNVPKIGKDSVEVVKFGSPPEVTFRGRVLDGTTGEPLAGVFIGGFIGHHADRDLADVTVDEWRAAEQLPSDPLPNAESLKPF